MTAVVALGDKYYVKDNVDTPDTMLAIHHPALALTSHQNPPPMFANRVRYGRARHDASLLFNRAWMLACILNASAMARRRKQRSRSGSRLRDGADELAALEELIACVKSRRSQTSEIREIRAHLVVGTTCILAPFHASSRLALDRMKPIDRQEDAAKPELSEVSRAVKLEV